MKCFIITPIGADNSEIRRKADGVINSVVKPVLLNDFKFEVVEAAHDINESGSINNQIMERIINSDLVIANLTTKNPNVMYEVAVRHATKKPIIHICEKGEVLPFDIVEQRTIFYSDDMQGVAELEIRIKQHIKKVLEDKESPDNPVFKALNEVNIYNSVSENQQIDSSLKDVLTTMLDKIDRLENKIHLSNQSNKNRVSTLTIHDTYDPDAVAKVMALHPYVRDAWEEHTEDGPRVCLSVDKKINDERIEAIVDDYHSYAPWV